MDWFRIGTKAGFCEQRNEPSDFIQANNFMTSRVNIKADFVTTELVKLRMSVYALLFYYLSASGRVMTQNKNIDVTASGPLLLAAFNTAMPA